MKFRCWFNRLNLFLLFEAVFGFRIPSVPQRATSLFSSTSSLEDAIERARAHFATLGGVDSIQKDLVQQGFQFQQLDESKATATTVTTSLDKVRGCVSNVELQTTLELADNEWVIRSVKGTSDALLSRGLLAIVASIVRDVPVSSVVDVPAEELTDSLGLRSTLSRGRNDGVASMWKTLQNQVKQTMQSGDEPISEDVTTKDVAPSTRNTVALLLSGGVDSSVALNLLLDQGYDVTAFYLKIWLQDEQAHLGDCPWQDDFEICQQVCEQRQVKLETISLQEEYHQRVVNYTIQQAQQGRTPNPDVLCNSRIKFGCFYDTIATRDFDYVATGHYAQLVRSDTSNDVKLYRAPDPVKDQSYFLCALSQEQLCRVLFPIGHLEKVEVRGLAEQYQLPNRHRPDSQGLCFLGQVKFDEFLQSYLGTRPGDIVDAFTGELLGRHQGVWFHTVGQRKGIGKVLFPKATARGPWYVVAKDPARDVVYCSNQYDEEVFASSRSQFTVEDIHWISKPTASVLTNVPMKIRHGPRLTMGTLTLDEEASTTGTVQLDRKDSLAPGQYVVFYGDDGECLGGGVISEEHWNQFLLQQQRQFLGQQANETFATTAV